MVADHKAVYGKLSKGHGLRRGCHAKTALHGFDAGHEMRIGASATNAREKLRYAHNSLSAYCLGVKTLVLKNLKLGLRNFAAAHGNIETRMPLHFCYFFQRQVEIDLMHTRLYGTTPNSLSNPESVARNTSLFIGQPGTLWSTGIISRSEERRVGKEGR